MPVKSNFFVGRIDRDLHANHRLMLSYRYFHLYQLTTSQVDIGGFFPGNTLGVPKSLTDRPQTPSFYVAGLTSVLTPRLINDFRFSYTRNSWEWGSAGAPAQLPGLGAALELGLLPYETARGNALSRYWNGHDYVVRDDLSLVHGNHLFQFGGTLHSLAPATPAQRQRPQHDYDADLCRWLGRGNRDSRCLHSGERPIEGVRQVELAICPGTRDSSRRRMFSILGTVGFCSPLAVRSKLQVSSTTTTRISATPGR